MSEELMQKVENLTKDDITFIKELSHEMKTQDTRCTAEPYALVLREEVMRLVPDGHGDELLCYWNENEYCEWDEFIIDLKEYYEYDTEAYCDYTITENVTKIIETMNNFSDLNGTHDASEIDATVYCVTYEREIKEDCVNFFLTEKAYHEHIRINGHNLNKPDSYGIHLTRNAEMQRLIEIVHNLAGELYENK